MTDEEILAGVMRRIINSPDGEYVCLSRNSEEWRRLFHPSGPAAYVSLDGRWDLSDAEYEALARVPRQEGLT